LYILVNEQLTTMANRQNKGEDCSET